MRTLEEVLKERKELDEQMKVLRDKDNALYWELRDIEKSELKQFAGKQIKIGDNLMYVRSQYLKDDQVELNGIRFEMEYKREYIPYESSELSARGRISFHVIVDEPIFIPLDEFRERTTGDYKDIYELDYKDFDKARQELYEDFGGFTSIFSWLNLTATYRD